MKLVKALIFPALIVISLSGVSGAVINFPYGNISMNFPVYSDPYPGLGSYYSALSNGVTTSLWNPAGIMKIATVEADATIPFNLGNFSYTRAMQIDDSDFAAGATELTA